MDEFQFIASWTGWPILVALLVTSFGVYNFFKDKELTRLRDAISIIEKGSGVIREEDTSIFDIKIVSPLDYDKVNHSFQVTGTYKNKPKNHTFWVFAMKGEGKQRKYWPQNQVSYNSQRQVWLGKVNYIGEKSGDLSEIGVFLVGSEGERLIEYYLKVGRENNVWSPILQLTSDILECYIIRVSLMDNLPQQTNTPRMGDGQLNNLEIHKQEELKSKVPDEVIDENYSAKLVSQNVKSVEIEAGKRFVLEVIWQNIGKVSWGRSVRMGTSGPKERPSAFYKSSSRWFSPNRIRFEQDQVNPGEKATFQIPMTAPTKSGVYRECFGLMVEDYRWFDECPNICVVIKVEEKTL